MKKSYTSLEELYRDLDTEFRANVPDKVQKLWQKIHRYAEMVGAEQGEGNSGEFYDEKEAERCQKERIEAETDVIAEFAKWTGWIPYRVDLSTRPFHFVNPNPKRGYSKEWNHYVDEYWSFRPVISISSFL